MKSIFDATFRYTPSYSTDLKKTFARVRQERRRAEQEANASGNGATVTRLQIEQKRHAGGKASGTRP